MKDILSGDGHFGSQEEYEDYDDGLDEEEWDDEWYDDPWDDEEDEDDEHDA